MLTAPWGTGKSHYINNHFINLVNNRCKKKCIVISLYDIDSIEKLCKSIFIESKFHSLNPSGKICTTASLIGKTIYHGLSGLINVDLGFKDKDYNKLFRVSNFSKYVLILEDIERSNINIIDLLGFVNNLTEIDDVRVIMVVSETDLKDKLGDNISIYEKVKEKSIFDTVHFYSDDLKTICDILSLFKDKYNDKILCHEELPQIIKTTINDAKIYDINYRSLQYGIQKYVDLSNKITFEVDQEFLMQLFLSIIIYSLKKRDNDGIIWNGEKQSEICGSEKYPLYDFVYSFINNQLFFEESVKKANHDFIQQKDYNNKQVEIAPYINTIIDYYRYSEIDIKIALEYISRNQEKVQTIPKQTCQRLYGALIAIGCAGVDSINIGECKNIIKHRFDKHDDEKCTSFYWDGAFSFDEESLKEWREFKEYIINIQEQGYRTPYDYSLDSISQVANRLYASHNDGFVCYFEMTALLDSIRTYSPSEMYDLRGVFIQVYQSGNPRIEQIVDYMHLVELKNHINILTSQVSDSIKRLQLRYFVSDLEAIIEGFNRWYPEEINVLNQQ